MTHRVLGFVCPSPTGASDGHRCTTVSDSLARLTLLAVLTVHEKTKISMDCTGVATQING